MAFERLPLERAERQLSSTESKISALGQVKSAIANLQEAAKNISDSGKLYSYKASLGNADVGTVTASDKAVSGTYSLEVTQLATHHKLTSATGLNFTSGGTLNIQVGSSGQQESVNITAGASLTDVAKAINGADAGVSATVVNGQSGQQLVLTSNETGSANKISITGDFTDLNFDSYSTNPSANTNSKMTGTGADDAVFKIDGIDLTATSNTITDAVTGVDLTLKTAGTTQLVIGNDTSELENRVGKFVEAYNNARNTMKTLSKYDASGDKNHGALNGDSTVRSAMDELRGLLSAVPAGASSAYPSLVDLGVESSSSGTLSVNTSKLQAATKADFASVSKTIAAYGSAFNTVATNMNGTDGLITGRLDGLNAATSRLKDTISAQETRLTTVQARYEKQFANLETLLSSLTTTSNYLTQQLSSLASMNS
jgi:flagellar hook-associated protein 2